MSEFAATALTSDGFFEMVDGRVVEKPPMGAFQGWFATNLSFLLSSVGEIRRAGRVMTEVLFVIDAVANLKRRPDLAFVSFDRWPRATPVPDVEGWDVIPDLAVEIISPSHTANEVVRKIDDYFRAGVRRVWVVYTNPRQIYVYLSKTEVRILQPADDLDGGALLPGLRLPIASLFEDAADV